MWTSVRMCRLRAFWGITGPGHTDHVCTLCRITHSQYVATVGSKGPKRSKGVSTDDVG